MLAPRKFIWFKDDESRRLVIPIGGYAAYQLSSNLNIYWFENEEYMQQAQGFIHCENIDGYLIGWVDES